MSTQETTGSSPGNMLRSTGAIVTGMVAVVVLSLGTDLGLRLVGLYPAEGAPMVEPALNLLALCYRCLYNVIGAYVVLVLASGNGLRLLWIFTLIGFTLAAIGAVVTIPMNWGPSWYPILLALSPFPCSWLGLKLHRVRGS
jgi:predicted exporter